MTKLLIGSVMIVFAMLSMPGRYGTLSEPKHPLIPKPTHRCGQEVPASCPSNVTRKGEML